MGAGPKAQPTPKGKTKCTAMLKKFGTVNERNRAVSRWSNLRGLLNKLANDSNKHAISCGPLLGRKGANDNSVG